VGGCQLTGGGKRNNYHRDFIRKEIRAVLSAPERGTGEGMWLCVSELQEEQGR